MPLTIDSLEHEPGSCSAASMRNLMIVVWPGRATAPAVDMLMRMSERMIAASPRGISGIHMIADKVSLPTPDGRTGLGKLTTVTAPHLACLSIVLGGTGFWASTMRSFITGLRLLAPRKFDLRMHTTADEVLECLPGVHEQRTGVHLDRDELAKMLEVAWTWPAQSGADPLVHPTDNSDL